MIAIAAYRIVGASRNDGARACNACESRIREEGVGVVPSSGILPVADPRKTFRALPTRPHTHTHAHDMNRDMMQAHPHHAI
jgi:hypothetical protein